MEKWTLSKRNLLTTGSLIIAVALLFTINIFSNFAFTTLRWDLTEKNLYTLSQGTRNILAKVDEPITLKLYYSKKLSNGLATVNSYETQVSELLQEYSRLSGGKIRLQQIDPEPYSEQEDVALAYGLTGIPMDESGSSFYFGLVGTNSIDIEKVIPFFQQEREAYLEYDITQVIYQLMHPNKPKLGVLTSLPLMGRGHAYFGQDETGAWTAWQQLTDLYEVEVLESTLSEIPEDINLLLLANPEGLSESALIAIDQYVLKGGHLLGFVDSYSETAGQSHVVSEDDLAGLNSLMASWGVQLEPGKVVADRNAAKQVWYNQEGRQKMVEYPFWFDAYPEKTQSTDLIANDLELLTFATPGYFSIKSDVGTQISTLVETSKEATVFDADALRGYQVDPERALREYKVDSKAYPLVVRVTGKAKTAFPQAAVAATFSKPHLNESTGEIQIVLVSDADMLHDQFWLRSQNFLGQPLVMPIASNGSLLLNAVDNLTGGSDLTSVRSRGNYTRPFTRLREIQRQAETDYRSTEEGLLSKLKETEKRLENLNDHSVDGEKLILSPAQKREIEAFRLEQVKIRKQLREVQHALQEDIETITDRIKLANVALAPLLVTVAGITFVIVRRRRIGHQQVKVTKS